MFEDDDLDEIEEWSLECVLECVEDEPAPDTTDQCFNCGCFGRDLGDGEYECENCGNTWNIYAESPDIP